MVGLRGNHKDISSRLQALAQENLALRQAIQGLRSGTATAGDADPVISPPQSASHATSGTPTPDASAGLDPFTPPRREVSERSIASSGLSRSSDQTCAYDP